MRILILLLIVTTCNFVTINGNVYFPSIKPDNEYWWSHSIVYQIYPRSFKDSNHDGIGDLKGITQKLDHFIDLGIDILWIGPIFKSPMDDLGYDVEDFRMIDPIFGTMDDFDELVSEMKKRNMKFITDMIPNHSSYKCEWYQKSINREGKYTDYYVWQNASNQIDIDNNLNVAPIPPNNWLSIFGGSAWTWNTKRRQFYFHQFSPKQPDFNVRNPLVRKELYDILEFWMDRGITGFRIDAIRHLFEKDTLEDEPHLPGHENLYDYDDFDHIYVHDQPESIEIIEEWRANVDKYKISKNCTFSKILSTESYSTVEHIIPYYGNSTHPGAHMPFNYIGVDKTNLVYNLDDRIGEWIRLVPKDVVSNWVSENHDNPRIATKYGAEIVPLFTALKLALPGVDVTYYGSEIGMADTYVRPDQKQDPNNAGPGRLDESRDYERCPMQWDNSINAGFTDAEKPWLPVNPNYYKINVEKQKKSPTSNYNFYKKMSQLRKTETLKYGDLETYNVSRSLYIIRRSLKGYETYIVVLNFGTETEKVDLQRIMQFKLNDDLYVYLGSKNSGYRGGNIIPRNYSTDHPFQLRPQSVVVLTEKFIAAENGSSKRSSNFNILLCTLLLPIYFLINYQI